MKRLKMKIHLHLLFTVALVLLLHFGNAQEDVIDYDETEMIDINTNEVETTTTAPDTITNDAPTCKKSDIFITETQDKAGTDISYIQRVIFEKLNRESLSSSPPITSVVIDYPGSSIHRHTGKYIIQARVTRAGDEKEECFEVTFLIEDVDECTLPEGHSMSHYCANGSSCVNTDGGYECICPMLDGSITSLESMASRSSWEVSLDKGLSTCPGKKSTFGCCDSDAHSESGHMCRSTFHCPDNPCSDNNNKCDENAECTLSNFPPEYSCRCPDKYLGNGQKCAHEDVAPAPKIDSKGNPTEETLQKFPNMCGCTLPTVDFCASFTCGKHETCTLDKTSEPQCVCAEGFVRHHDHGCIDGSPPKLILKCDPFGNGTNILRQGDEYDHGCDAKIEDSNPEEYSRSLKVSYKPSMLQACSKDVGEYEVTYTITTPWTDPPFAEVTRKVIVEDLDECSLSEEQLKSLEERGCESLIPKCVPEAQCQNNIGSYACECPEYTSGDGFLNGTGCVDTHPPLITLLGPSTKVFRTAAAAGLSGVLSTSPSATSEKEKRRLRYEGDINYLITSTNEKELCATSENIILNNCVTAVDITPFGKVDLTSKVTLGTLEQVEDQAEKDNEFLWKIGYNVADEAGNEATIYRTIQVLEVTLNDMEKLVTETKNAQPVREKVESKKIESKKIESKKIECPKCEKCPSCKIPPTPKIEPCPVHSTQPAPTCNVVDELNKFILFVNSNLPIYSPAIILYSLLAIVAFLFLTYWLNHHNESNNNNANAQQPNIVYYTSPAGRVSETPRRYTPNSTTQTPASNGNGFTTIPPPTNSIMSPGLSYSPHPNRDPQDIYER